MSSSTTENHQGYSSDIVTRHSLLWLMIVCTTGVLLATLLLVPSLGRLFEPFSYGRWVTVHLNSALYGWSSVPLIGLLFLVYLPHQKKSPVADTAVIVWSSVLLFALIGWLSGHTSGKLFMEWSGASRWAILCGMAFLATALWIAYIQRLKEQPESRPIKILKVLSLISLSVIPFVMYLAADPSLYPPINPDSGGATGGSLLGSTLGIVVIYWITPFVLGLKVGTSVPLVRSFLPSFILLLLHFAAFSLLDHGDRSHHEIGQIVALASLVVWVPLLVRHMNRFVWPASSRRWLIAFAGWGGVLTLNGLFTFMPHVLDHWKFTNALVAHVHIAMAGMITSFNILILVVLNQSSPLGRAFSSRGSFWAWQLGTVVHAVALLAAGTLEALHPAWLFTGHPAMNVLYGVRLAAGLVMLTAAWFWFGLVHKNQGVA